MAKAAPPSATPAQASLDATLDAILRLMQPGKEYSRAELADVLGLTASRWNAAIKELKCRGRVRQVGERRGARYVVA
jgi:type I restriction enzyme S subunit